MAGRLIAMTKKQKLELAWIEKENEHRTEPRIRLEFSADPQRDDSPLLCREAILDACGDPRCGCLGIHFEWLAAPDDPQPKPLQDFWYDLEEDILRLTPELEKDPEVLRLGEILHAELTTEMRAQLREWFFVRKLAIIESTPLDDIDLTDLPDSSDRKMVGFVDVFPCGQALDLTWNNEAWAVDEQYCVQPRCTCKDAVLSFLKLSNASGNKTASIGDPPALRYNYISEASKPVSRGPSGSPSLNALLDALKREHPDLNSQLRLRHNIMQSLYLRQNAERLKARLAAMENNPPRTGRNDPCPCGSGRKYKHCCLNKPRP
jgi:hypothetical protein